MVDILGLDPRFEHLGLGVERLGHATTEAGLPERLVLDAQPGPPPATAASSPVNSPTCHCRASIHSGSAMAARSPGVRSRRNSAALDA